MVLRQVRIGSIPDMQYDDADYDSAIETSQPMKAGTPVDANDVLRLGDLTVVMLPPTSVVNIDNPTELNTIAGTPGVLIVVHGVVPATGLDTYTIYAYDASGPAVSAPYIMDAAGAGDERWIAIAGKYRISTIMNTLGTKNPPIDADLAIYRDSAAAFALVTSTWTQIKAFLKLYFDTIYTSITGCYRHNGDVLDESHFHIPTPTNGAYGVLDVGLDEERAEFTIAHSGVVNLIMASSKIVANADGAVGVNFCIGTAGDSSEIKNRLGATKAVMLQLWYN